mgnify:CR=1 FL=1
MTVVVLQPAEGTAIDRGIGSTTSRSETADDMWIGYSAVPGRQRAVMKWDLTSIPTNATITASTLTLKNKSDNYPGWDSETIRIFRITNQGMTESATWTTYDGTNNWTVAGGDYTATDAVTLAWDDGDDIVVSDSNFVSLVQDAIDNRSRYLSIVVASQRTLDGSTTGRYIKVYSSSAASSSNYPALSVTYVVPAHYVGGTGLTLASAAAWSTGAVPTGGTGRFTIDSAAADATGSITLKEALISDGWSGNMGTSTTDVTLTVSQYGNLIIDKPYGDLFVTVNPTGSKAGAVIIRGVPPADNHDLKLKATLVVISAKSGGSFRGNGEIQINSASDIGTLVVSNTSGMPINVNANGTIGSIVVSGPANLRGAPTTASGIKVVGPAANVDLSGVVVGDSRLVKSTAKFTGTVSRNNDVIVSESTMSVVGGGTTVFVGDTFLYPGGRFMLSGSGNVTFGDFFAMGGSIVPKTPVSISISSYSRLSSTSGRSLNFSDAANSGHFIQVMP